MSSLAAKFVTPFVEWKHFTANVDVNFEARDYQVKTVSTVREWYSVLRFRREVFLREYGIRKVLPFGVDIDRHDWSCDQLMVINKNTGQLIGCYRVLCSEFTDRFYSESEFDLSHIKRLPGIKVELGRACVHPDFRNGVVMQLLWRGIADYIRQVGASYAFGCTSVKCTDPILVKKMELRLRMKEALMKWPPVPVKRPFQFTAEERSEQSRILMLEESEFEMVDDQLPSLLKFYLRLGARFSGRAAIDRKFSCVDFFTLFDFSSLPAHMKAKYQL